MESAVRVQHRRVRAVLLQILPVRQEHRDAGAVLTERTVPRVGVWTARSGEPLVVTVSNSLLNNGSRNYANVICDHPGTPGNVGEWFDTGCFTNPPAFTYGNAGIGHVRGPSLVNQDFSLGKSTKFKEKRSLEFRAEFFNIFNSAHLGNPATTLGNSDFGTISSTVGTPREVQLGLKFQF